MPVLATVQGRTVPVRLWAQAHAVESAALDQLRNLASLPWVHHHVSAMPDCHLGKGATVGSVVAMRGAVSPAAVGVDIGCGMIAARLGLTADRLPDSLAGLRDAIEAQVPVGFASHSSAKGDHLPLWREFADLHPKAQRLEQRARNQLGTLGGGNHFIELCLDEDGGVWLMLHSGSRNIGKSLAEMHMSVAKDLPHNEGLPDRDLAVFLSGTPEMDAYWRDLTWAQRYAAANRELMLGRVLAAVRRQLGDDVEVVEQVNCHHNYVSAEHHYGEDVLVTRKGAIAAHAGTRGVIPGSMGTRSYVVTGLGSEEAFCSASHGAGRRMSRGQARRQFTADDLAAQTAGVECRKDVGVVDEIPGAYKDIDEVMAAQTDLVRVDAVLKQVLCVKG